MIETFPKISIVTPNYNQAKYIELTIQSVLSQNYPNLEYIIIDGGSTDGSVEIIKKYANQLTYWVSEKDNGLYDALNKGFNKSTGEVLMYINSDDILIQGSLKLIGKLFNSYPQIKWMTGYYNWLNEENEIIGVRRNLHWSILDYINGNYQWIQQESTVWSRSAWIDAGAKFNTKYKLAADLDLWCRFFLQSNPVVVDFSIGAFRIRKNQLSQLKIEEYHAEAKSAITELKLKANKNILKKAKYLKILSYLKYWVYKTKLFSHFEVINFINKQMLKVIGLEDRIVYLHNSWIKIKETDISLYRI